MEIDLSVLGHTSMPLKFWDEAFITTVFLINCLPPPIIKGDTPYERLFGKQPDYSFLQTFGCACWPNLHPYNARKLEFRSKRCMVLGYNNLHKGFKCLDPSEGHVYILVMLYLMSMCFLFPYFIQMLAHASVLSLPFFQIYSLILMLPLGTQNCRISVLLIPYLLTMFPILEVIAWMQGCRRSNLVKKW
jgi:hypothetical protein